MLSAAHRLRDPEAFRRTSRRGERAATRTVVVHRADGAAADGPQVGVVASRRVGSAVVRNRVKRRIRHVMRARLNLLDGSTVVVRAKPSAARASSGELAADIDQALARVRGARP